MTIQPYLFFGGRCEEALAFYRQAIDAQVVMMMRFRDAPDPPPPGAVASGSDDRVMHAELRIGPTTIMASDGAGFEPPGFQGFSLFIAAADAAEAERLFTALSQDGQVTMPLGPTFFSPAFGMLRDRFGVGWMVGVPAPGQATAGQTAS